MSGLPLPPPRVSASFFPSGDQAGAPFTPLWPTPERRSPVRTSCTYTSRSLALERHVGEPLAIRRPRGDISGKARLQNEPLILAVGIRDDELIVLGRRLTLDRDVGDTCGKRAANAEDLLVHDIAYPVRGVTQRARHAHEALGHDALARQRIDEVEVHRDLTALHRGQATDHHVVRAGILPVGGHHIIGARRGRRRQRGPDRARNRPLPARSC
jgi:hypothetical protein